MVDPTPSRVFAPRPCTKCGLTFGVEGFEPLKGYRDGYSRQCRKCRSDASHARRKARRAAGEVVSDPERDRRYAREWHERNPHRNAERLRKSKYGLTEDRYEEMLVASGGLCAICRQEMKKPCVDHCHATGKVRGLLCLACNFALGHMRDDPVRLSSAIDYLNSTS